jgi:hypothetical protein
MVKAEKVTRIIRLDTSIDVIRAVALTISTTFTMNHRRHFLNSKRIPRNKCDKWLTSDGNGIFADRTRFGSSRRHQPC